MIKDTIKWALMGFFIVIVGLIVFFFLSVDSVFAEGIACEESNTGFTLSMTDGNNNTNTTSILLNNYYGTSPSASNFSDYVTIYRITSNNTLSSGENWTLSIQFKVHSVTDNLPHLTKNNFSLYWGNTSTNINNLVQFSDDTFSFDENGSGIDTTNSNRYTVTYTLNMKFGFSSAHYIKLVYNPNSGNGVNQGISFNSICLYNDNSPVDSTTQIIENNNQNTTNIINNNNYNSEKEREAINNNTNAINNLNSNMTDSSVDNPSSSINSMINGLPTDSVITSVILLPVTLFQTILNYDGSECVDISFGKLFGTSLTLPCIDLYSLLGNRIWTAIDYFCCFVFLLGIRKTFIKVFNNMTNLRDRGNELE